MNIRLFSYVISVLLSVSSFNCLAEGLNYGIVELSAQATQTVARDEMVLMLKIQQQGTNRQQVSNTVTTRLNQVLATARRHDDFNTTQLTRTVEPKFEYQKDKRIDNGWQDSALLQVKSTNLSALNKFAADVQNLAVIVAINYQVADTTLQNYEAKLTRQAIARFQQRAVQIAHELGGHDYKVVSMSLGSSQDAQNYGAYAAPVMLSRAADTAPVQDIAAGETQLTLSINGKIQVTGLP
ncbi:SIMPL domain-containing protein [Snodgrassella sp. ESL0253]|uniref:SIMPL domain-containing protein n=1 Tax=Snodgrassella sp. ESL0253 TaxID=2705031 RepID=UPI00158184B2|nr:SIMPL domain-containing protein [Snodgrassella sp. ESL0253]NUE66371.1 SIMPL domain-containing protein [Snodgrassella sp. ESL0253]